MNFPRKLRRLWLPALVSAGLAAALVSAGATAATAASPGYSVSRVPGAAVAIGTAVDPATDTVYITSTTGLEVVDGATGTVTTTIPLTDPVGVAVNAATDTVYVALAMGANPGGSIDVINGATNAITASISEPPASRRPG